MSSFSSGLPIELPFVSQYCNWYLTYQLLARVNAHASEDVLSEISRTEKRPPRHTSKTLSVTLVKRHKRQRTGFLKHIILLQKGTNKCEYIDSLLTLTICKYT